MCSSLQGALPQRSRWWSLESSEKLTIFCFVPFPWDTGQKSKHAFPVALGFFSFSLKPSISLHHAVAAKGTVFFLSSSGLLPGLRLSAVVSLQTRKLWWLFPVYIVFVYVCRFLRRPDESIGCVGTGVRTLRAVPLCAGTWTQVLCKSSTWFNALSHPFSPHFSQNKIIFELQVRLKKKTFY